MPMHLILGSATVPPSLVFARLCRFIPGNMDWIKLNHWTYTWLLHPSCKIWIDMVEKNEKVKLHELYRIFRAFLYIYIYHISLCLYKHIQYTIPYIHIVHMCVWTLQEGSMILPICTVTSSRVGAWFYAPLRQVHVAHWPQFNKVNMYVYLYISLLYIYMDKIINI